MSCHIFSFYDTATTEIYTLSLHDALPISIRSNQPVKLSASNMENNAPRNMAKSQKKDRKSTRLNSSHPSISYAVFCLKKKNKIMHIKLSVGITDTELMLQLRHNSHLINFR